MRSASAVRFGTPMTTWAGRNSHRRVEAILWRGGAVLVRWPGAPETTDLGTPAGPLGSKQNQSVTGASAGGFSEPRLPLRVSASRAGSPCHFEIGSDNDFITMSAPWT
jgi:hypothetical protein